MTPSSDISNENVANSACDISISSSSIENITGSHWKFPWMRTVHSIRIAMSTILVP